MPLDVVVQTGLTSLQEFYMRQLFTKEIDQVTWLYVISFRRRATLYPASWSPLSNASTWFNKEAYLWWRYKKICSYYFFFKETTFSAEIEKIKKYKLSLIEPQIIILIIFNKILQPLIYWSWSQSWKNASIIRPTHLEYITLWHTII